MKVIQLIDSLHAGGAERMAVNLANGFSHKVDKSFLCSTREEGVLKNSIHKNVEYLFLKKTKVFDWPAIKKLNTFIKINEIDIIHAHSSSFFLATVIKVLNKKVKLVWHDHYGNSEFLSQRRSRILRMCSRYFDQAYCVNRILENWGKLNLKVQNIEYLPNFAVENEIKGETELSGNDGQRIICLANLRPQKDHINLITAFSDVVNKYPEWTLHLVGKDFNDEYSKKITEDIGALGLEEQIFLYGSRPDTNQILRQCEIGVLSSRSEGLPLALLEYGLSGLAVISTNVGEIENVIDSELNGLIIEPGNHFEMQKAMIKLIEDKNKRRQLASNFQNHVLLNYSSDAVINKLVNRYKVLK